MDKSNRISRGEAWARFRFAVIGRLLSAPPPHGELAQEIERLAQTSWTHPVTGDPVRFGKSTIENWFYKARACDQNPVGALKRQVRKDQGRIYLNPDLAEKLRAQYAAYPHWSYLLHTENLGALVRKTESLGPMPSYSTILRYMHANDMRKRNKPKKHRNRSAAVHEPWERRETRSFEAEYVGGLWHLDFHHCSRKVLAPNGQWYTPMALGVHDDRSRLACHVQWYLTETAEDLVHGLCQAVQKWRVPRVLMTDNGAAMKAEEFVQGLARLGITHETTLPYSPHQNAKEEFFWGPLEARLIAMLKHVKVLTLAFLNEATQAWVDLDYNRKHHSEIGQTPLERFIRDRDVLRPSPSSNDLRRAFRLQAVRTQRRSDGTLTIEGVRFEIPGRFRHMATLVVRYARWDLGLVDLVDTHTGALLCRIYPLDKEANADGRRRRIELGANRLPAESTPDDELPPLLREMLERYAASGKPPGYIPKPPASPAADAEAGNHRAGGQDGDTNRDHHNNSPEEAIA